MKKKNPLIPDGKYPVHKEWSWRLIKQMLLMRTHGWSGTEQTQLIHEQINIRRAASSVSTMQPGPSICHAIRYICAEARPKDWWFGGYLCMHAVTHKLPTHSCTPYKSRFKHSLQIGPPHHTPYLSCSIWPSDHQPFVWQRATRHYARKPD